jgi:hypothetical protein
VQSVTGQTLPHQTNGILELICPTDTIREAKYCRRRVSHFDFPCNAVAGDVMSQYPQYPQQNPYAPPVPNYYTGATGSRRPASVTSIAIIGIIVGSIGLLCAAPSLVLNAMMLGDGKNPIAPQLPAMSHNVVVISVFQTFINSILSLVMLICCIAALSLKPFARKVMIPASVVTLVWAVALVVITVGWINPEGQRVMSGMNQRAGAVSPEIQKISQLVGVILSTLFIAAVPVCVLIFWTRLHVKAAFGDPEAMAKYASMQPQPSQYPPNQFPPTQFPPPSFPQQ